MPSVPENELAKHSDRQKKTPDILDFAAKAKDFFPGK
jgi:hypothetical protein